MMEKPKHSQLELFYQGQDLNEKKANPQLSNSFWVYIRNYERIILIIIGFIITGVISFCLGVERGKFDVAQKYELKSPAPVIEKAAQPVNVKDETVQPEIQEGGYTIQVASYQTKTNAEREKESLEKKGFSALILSKGKYIIVCVGNFSDKEKAKSLQLRLRQNYRDCYIRRL